MDNKAINELHLSLGVSKSKVADYAGVDKAAYCRWLLYGCPISDEVKLKVKEFFKNFRKEVENAIDDVQV